jgi:hypothetical protein
LREKGGSSGERDFDGECDPAGGVVLLHLRSDRGGGGCRKRQDTRAVPWADEVCLMGKEFFVAFLKKVALFGPFAVIPLLIPPAPLSTKVGVVLIFLILMFLLQSLELLVVQRNGHRSERIVPPVSVENADLAAHTHAPNSGKETRRSRRERGL